jgi:alcohol dehydrogenase
MWAAAYHEFGGTIRVQQVAIPVCPDDGVVIRVGAVGVCRSDWHGWKGHDGDVVAHGLPMIPGHEVSGVVIQSNVPLSFRPGDRVAVPFILSCGHCEYCTGDRDDRDTRRRRRPPPQPTVCKHQKQPGFTQYGGFAEYLALPRAKRNLCVIPDAVTLVQAAALGCRFTTAFRAVVQQGQLQPSDSIAIFGCGGLGLSCVLLAVAQGCQKIIALDVSDRALNKALELGATHTINTSDETNDKVRARVQQVTQTDGAHVTVEASGFGRACEQAVHCTRPGGRMVQVGLVKEAVSVPMDIVAAREVQIVGSHGFAASDLPVLLNMVATGKLDPARLIEKEVTLTEGAQAIEDMDHGSPLGITMVTKFPKMRNRETSRL